MDGFFSSLLHYTFLQNAVLAALLAGVAAGISGTYVVLKRISYLSGGIAHAVMGGVGLGLFLDFDPYIGALLFGLFSAFVIGVARMRGRQDEDILVSTLWSLGMAAGIILMHLKPGYKVDLMTYLFGNIALVGHSQLLALAGLDLLLVVVAFLLHRPFLAVCFDEDHARLRGLPVSIYYITLLLLTATAVVVLMRIVGIILVITLLTLPAVIAGFFSRSPGSLIIKAIVISMLLNILGLYVSYQPDLPPGPVIIVLYTLVYALAYLARKYWLHRKNRML